MSTIAYREKYLKYLKAGDRITSILGAESTVRMGTTEGFFVTLDSNGVFFWKFDDITVPSGVKAKPGVLYGKSSIPYARWVGRETDKNGFDLLLIVDSLGNFNDSLTARCMLTDQYIEMG